MTDVAATLEELNAQSTANAARLVASDQPISALIGLSEGITEFVRVYDPDSDGGVSFSDAMNLMMLRVVSHTKALELRDWQGDVLLPAATSVKEAWKAFLSQLSESEIERSRMAAIAAIDNNDLASAARMLEVANAAHGPDAEVLADLAEIYFAVGDVAGAVQSSEMALNVVPNHMRTRSLLQKLETALAAQPA